MGDVLVISSRSCDIALLPPRCISARTPISTAERLPFTVVTERVLSYLRALLQRIHHPLREPHRRLTIPHFRQPNVHIHLLHFVFSTYLCQTCDGPGVVLDVELPIVSDCGGLNGCYQIRAEVTHARTGALLRDVPPREIYA